MKKIIIGTLFLVLALSGCKQNVQETTYDDVAVMETDTSSKTDSIEQEVAEVELADHIGEWKLVWHDEFEGKEINMDNWTYDVPSNGRWNGEIQSYTNNNAFIQDGALIIEAREETITESSGESYDYSSGKLITQGKQKFTYGRIEIRAKMPTGQGVWPALWMMPENEQLYGTWPVCGEIDIMEMLGNKPDEIHGTVHFGEPHQQIQGTYNLPKDQSFADDYHIYRIEWQPGRIEWYLDDVLYHTASDWYSKLGGSSQDYPYPAPFDQDFYIIMNISVGGSWPGNPDDTTVFPQQMAVDYIRVYEKEDYEVFAKPVLQEIEARKPLEDGNYLYNGRFDQGDFEVETAEGEASTVDEWTFFQGPAGVSTYSVSDGVLHVQIDKGGETDYAVQVFQTPVHLKQGSSYEVSFDVKADEEREIKIKIGSDGDRNWVDYANEPPMTVSTEWSTLTFTFEMSDETDVKARFEFNMGLNDADVYIKNVRIGEVSEQ